MVLTQSVTQCIGTDTGCIGTDTECIGTDTEEVHVITDESMGIDEYMWHSRRKSTFRHKNTKMSYLYHVVALTLLYLLVLVVLQSVLPFPSYKGKRVDH